MEGIALNLRWLRDHVEKFAGQRFEQLNFIGGAAQSEVWCQILADVLGRGVRPVANPRFANAVGAALSAFVALGRIEPEQIPGAIELAAAYSPEPEAARVYDERFDRFMELYRRNRRIYRRMNG
jgi:xylulokinase